MVSHGRPGPIVPRKRVGVGSVMWLQQDKNLCNPGNCVDRSMCKASGGRDYETSPVPHTYRDRVSNAVANLGVELGLGIEEGSGKNMHTAKDGEACNEHEVAFLATASHDLGGCAAADIVNEMRFDCCSEGGEDEEAVSQVRFDYCSEGGEEEEAVSQVQEAPVHTIDEAGDDVIMDFNEWMILLDARPQLQENIELLSQPAGVLDSAHAPSVNPEMLRSALSFPTQLMHDREMIRLAPPQQQVVESGDLEGNGNELFFVPLPPQEPSLSGTGLHAQHIDEHDFLSLPPQLRDSRTNIYDCDFNRNEGSSDSSSVLYEGSDALDIAFGTSVHLPALNTDVEEQRSIEPLYNIDHERPRQSYGSVLASEAKFSGSIPSVDGTGMVFNPMSSSAVHKKDSSRPTVVDLTDDTDDDEDIIEYGENYDQLGPYGKRRIQDQLESDRKKRLNLLLGSSEHWAREIQKNKELLSKPRLSAFAQSDDWSERSNSLAKGFKSKSWGSVSNHGVQSWSLTTAAGHPSGDGLGLFSDLSVPFVGGRNVPLSKAPVEPIPDGGSSMQMSLFHDQHSKRVLPISLGGATTPSHTAYVGQSTGAFPARQLEDKAYESYMQKLLGGNNKEEATPGDGLLSVPLLKHQRLALAWMEKRELGGLPQGGILADDQGLGKTISTISLILKARAPIQKFSVEAVESSQAGALTVDLDDDDDCKLVGNTQDTTIEIDDKDDTRSPPTSVMGPERKQEDTKPGLSKGRPAAGNLVVCPTSVLRQWSHELKEKVTEEAGLSVLIYHGSNRTKDPDELAKYDVVLTTYSIVSMEVPKQPLPEEKDNDKKNSGSADYDFPPPFRAASKAKKPKKTTENANKSRTNGKGRLVEGENGTVDSGPLARVTWFRVILDEAQSIKNARTQVARAAWGLRAKRRWCLSGTPIQNAIDDLYSYFRFLRYAPFDAYKTFRERIKDPVTRTPTEGYKTLQLLLLPVMLRRTKATLIDGLPIVNLPPRIVTLKQAEFSDEERAFYCNLENESRKQFQDYAAAGTLQSNYVNILWMLLRLRQACDHPLLVKGHKSQGAQKVVLDSARRLPTEQRLQLLTLLEANRSICSICNDLPDEAVVCICTHIFCRQCISEQLATGDDTCCPLPKCRKHLNTSLVFTLASLKNFEFGEGSSTNSVCPEGTNQECNNTEDTTWESSSKINAVIDTLSALPRVYMVVENGKVVVGKDLEHVKNEESSCSRIVTDGQPLMVKTEGHLVVKGDQVSTANQEPVSIDTVNTREPVMRQVVESTEKAIVFSQWTSMLDLLEVKLKQSKFNYRRLDGTMSVLARDRAVLEFKTLPEVTVIIMSLKAASLGLNMVAASHVLLLDVWWNPTTEDQAIDRAHRIGQTRTVNVSRFTVKHTIEDRILELQERKRQMVASAFGENEGGGQKSRLTMEDLQYLFRI